MAQTLERKFKGKEKQVLEEVQRDGIGVVMERYGLEKRWVFSKWINRHQDDALSKLAGLSGGGKALFCRQHRETIIDCLEIFGEDFVMEKFHIRNKYTLNNIIKGENTPFFWKLNKTERLELQVSQALMGVKDIQQRLGRIETHLRIHDADIAEERGKINELINFVKSFSENVSETVARVLIQPLIQRTLQDSCGGMELKIKDPLELDFPTELEPTTLEQELEPNIQETGSDLVPADKPGFESAGSKLKETYMQAHPMAGQTTP